MNAQATALVDYMIELCQEHRSAGWVSNWEHEVWDAMLSDGTVGHYRDEFESDVKLLDEELGKLRALFKEANCWPVFKPDNGKNLRFVLALVPFPGTLEVLPHQDTVPLPVPVWKHLHVAWLHTPVGRYNKHWRDHIQKETDCTVDELAVMRDRVCDPEYQALCRVLRKRTDTSHPATQVVRAWLPKAVLEEILNGTYA